MANRLCPLCGEAYVDWATACATCGVALVDPDSEEDPRQLPEEDQLVYELGGWTLDQRAEVSAVMADSGIPHAWDGDELYVHTRFETAVDRLLEPIEYPDGVPEGLADVVGDDGPLEVAEPEGELTEYDLAEWTAGARSAVSAQLASAGLAHRWEGSLLLVSVDDEEHVDELLDELEDSGALDDADGRTDAEGDETPGEVLEALFLAADRLRKNALDAGGLADLTRAMELADARRPPYGVDPLAWRRITALADELVAAETGDADEVNDLEDAELRGESRAAAVVPDPVAAEEVAAELRELLRPYV